MQLKKIYSHYSTAIFDCDGVILNSNKIKSDSFAELFSEYPPEKIDSFLDYHKKNGGISRFEKIEHFLTKLVENQPEKLQPTIAQKIKEYGEIVSNKLIDCQLIPGVTELLIALNKNDTACYVNSGGFEDELNYVFESRGLFKFFKGIYGSPNSKADNMKRIPSTKGKTIFFGDSKLDYQTAQSFKCDFIFVSGFSEWDNPPNFKLPDLAIKDFHDL